MPDVTYLIIGGGMTADAAVGGIREIDPDGSIAIVGAEPEPPYKRPLLSKGLWNGKPLSRIWSDTASLGVELHLGRRVVWLDPEARCAGDGHGTIYGYDKLLLATGSSPRHLAVGDPRVISFRTLSDYWRLRSLATTGQHFAVVGGGFIGSEIAAALASQGKEVTLLFPGKAIGDRIFPGDLALSLNDRYRERGVQVLPGESIVGVATCGDRTVLRLQQVDHPIERELVVDGVVTGIGTRPNVELAQGAGLTVGDGIVVDRYLRTSDPHIFAAGDVASVIMPVLGGRRRFEHEDSARTMGRHAGRVMAGELAPYDHLPFFYSDLFDRGYEAVGDLDPRGETIADWVEPFREGVVYYLRDNRVRGVLLWNVWDRVPDARALIRSGEPVDLDDLGWSLLLKRADPAA